MGAVEIICVRCGAKDERLRRTAKLCRKCAGFIQFKPPCPMKICEQCQVAAFEHRAGKRFCYDCSLVRMRASRRFNRGNPPANNNELSRQITKFAVKVGFLIHPSNYICVDCRRRQAECYDHRDYTKPLDVEAVCLPCNSSRGRGIPFHKPTADIFPPQVGQPQKTEAA